MDRAGFTLLETLVVLAILALATTLFVPFVGGHGGRVSAEAGARTMAAALGRARAQAIAGNVEARYLISAESQAKDGLKVTLTVAKSELEGEGTGGIRFYPDGSSSGGAISFDDGAKTVTVAVDWLTGGIDVRQR